MASLIKRNHNYYILWHIGKKIKRKGFDTESYQIAK
jgi:hypothetical protein